MLLAAPRDRDTPTRFTTSPRTRCRERYPASGGCPPTTPRSWQRRSLLERGMRGQKLIRTHSSGYVLKINQEITFIYPLSYIHTYVCVCAAGTACCCCLVFRVPPSMRRCFFLLLGGSGFRVWWKSCALTALVLYTMFPRVVSVGGGGCFTGKMPISYENRCLFFLVFWALSRMRTGGAYLARKVAVFASFGLALRKKKGRRLNFGCFWLLRVLIV